MFYKNEYSNMKPPHSGGYLREISQKRDNIHCIRNQRQSVPTPLLAALNVIFINQIYQRRLHGYKITGTGGLNGV